MKQPASDRQTKKVSNAEKTLEFSMPLCYSTKVMRTVLCPVCVTVPFGSAPGVRTSIREGGTHHE